MPIYNDNRMFLFHPHMRRLIAQGLADIIQDQEISPEVVAGTATAGIPHGALLADLLLLPYIYIRDKPKAHGLKNRIEGLDADSDLGGRNVVVIEDLISTGGSSARAVEAPGHKAKSVQIAARQTQRLVFPDPIEHPSCFGCKLSTPVKLDHLSQEVPCLAFIPVL